MAVLIPSKAGAVEWYENFDDQTYLDHFNVPKGQASDTVPTNPNNFSPRIGNGYSYNVYTTTGLTGGETTPYLFGLNSSDLGRRYKFDLHIGPETGSPRHDTKNFKLIQFGDGAENTLYLRKLETSDTGPFYKTDLNGAVEANPTVVSTSTLRFGIGNGSLFLINNTDLDQFRSQWIQIEVEFDCNPASDYLKIWINGELDFYRSYGSILQNCWPSQRYFGSIGSFSNAGSFASVAVDNFYKFDTVRTNDATAPVRLNGAPSGTLDPGTTQTEISLDTDENAVCRYSTTAAVPFDSMTIALTNTGLMRHSSIITGLSNGGSYTFYVRCRDEAGNINSSDFPITFTVGNITDTAPPERFAGYPPGEHFAAGTTAVTIGLSTNEAANCSYSDVLGTDYASMTALATTDNFHHHIMLSGLLAGTHEYYVRCQDLSPQYNTNIDDYPITFTISSDLEPPLISLLSPEPGIPVTVTTDELSITTDEPATCKFATASGLDFSLMTLFASTGDATSHTQPLSGLVPDGRTYHYEVKCSDILNNITPSDYEVVFSMADLKGPTIAEVTAVTTPTKDATPSYIFSSDEAGTITYGGGCSSATTDAVVGENTITFNALGDGSYADCTVTVIDASDNPSSPLSVSSFTVDTTAPVRSAGAPSGNLTGGTTSTTISLTTNENATCRYSTASGVAYASMTNTFAGGGATSHSATVSGLVDGGSYTFYVRCADALGNPNLTDYPISFGVADATAPTLAEVTPVPSPTTDNTPSYTFSSTESGTITYGGGCSSVTTSAVAGNNPITFNALSDGTYSACTLRVTDGAANPSTLLAISPFTVNAGAPARSGGSPTSILPSGTTTATLSLVTDEVADCRYAVVSGTNYASMSGTFITADGLNHSRSVTGLISGSNLYYYVRCQDGQGNTNTDDYSIVFSVAAAAAGGGGGATESTDVQVDITKPSGGTIITSEEYTFRAETENADSVSFYYRADGSSDDILLGKDSSDSDGVYSITVDVRETFQNGNYTLIAKAKNDDDDDSDKASFSVELYYPPAENTAAVTTNPQATGSTGIVPLSTESATVLDSDGDGIPDTEEARLGTSATTADSDGDGVPDEKEILAGTDPLKKATDSGGDKISFESAKDNGRETETLRIDENPRVPSGSANGKKVRFTGKGKPNSYVTVYVYSEQPVIVSVKTDAYGAWTADVEVEEGNHEAYVTITDRTGKVSQKSQPLAFVKTAQAVNIVPLLEVSSPGTLDDSPVERTKSPTTMYFFIASGIFLLLALVIIGMMVRKKDEV